MLDRPEAADELADALLHACEGRKVFALRGELGAGKTTLIKAMCRKLGVEEQAASPSFAIVHEYQGRDGEGADRSERVYHFDLYRLKDASELEAIGFHEYLDSGAYCFVEWPELAAGQLPADTVNLRIGLAGEARTVQIDLQPAGR